MHVNTITQSPVIWLNLGGMTAACTGYFILFFLLFGFCSFSAFANLKSWRLLCCHLLSKLKSPSISLYILLILSSPTIYSKIFSIKTYRHKWNRADPIKIWTHAIYRNDDWWVMNYLLLTCLSKSEKHTSNIIILLFNIFYFITVTFFF